MFFSFFNATIAYPSVIAPTPQNQAPNFTAHCDDTSCCHSGSSCRVSLGSARCFNLGGPAQIPSSSSSYRCEVGRVLAVRHVDRTGKKKNKTRKINTKDGEGPSTPDFVWSCVEVSNSKSIGDDSKRHSQRRRH